MKSYSSTEVGTGVQLTVQGYPARSGPGGIHVPKTVQGIQKMIIWRNEHEGASDYWLRLLICAAFQRMFPRRMQDAPAADVIEIVAEDWVEIIGEGMTEEQDLERIIAGFKLIFRECKRWPQPAELLKRLPRRMVKPQSGTVNVETVDEAAHERSAEALNKIIESLGCRCIRYCFCTGQLPLQVDSQEASMTKLELTADDTNPLICGFSAAGFPVDITGYAFTLKIGYPEPRSFVATILDAAAGKYQFPFIHGDLIAGIYSAEVMVTNPAGKEETTEKFQIKIEERLI